MVDRLKMVCLHLASADSVQTNVCQILQECVIYLEHSKRQSEQWRFC